MFVADTYNNRVVKVTPQGQVVTVAGDGAAGYSGDGRLAAFAELNSPTGVAVDSDGNLYIADSANNVIRRVDAKTGIITTVAGDYAADKANDGLGGFSGDGGPATSAQLERPAGRRRRRRGRPVHRRHLQQRHPRGHPGRDHHHRRQRRHRRPAAPRRPAARAAARPRPRPSSTPPTASRSTPAPTTSTSPTPTTARSPRSPASPSPATPQARPPLLSPDAAGDETRDIHD